MSLEARLRRWFGDGAPTRFGTGWMSGVGSVFLGAVGLLAVVCFHLPALLTLPELRALYPLGVVRAAVEIVIGAPWWGASHLATQFESRRPAFPSEAAWLATDRGTLSPASGGLTQSR